MRAAPLALMVLAAALAGPLPALAQKGAPATVQDAQADRMAAFLATLPARFAVDGTNPDGTAYAGTAALAWDAATGRATIRWQVGADSFEGSGPVEDGRLVIDWGQDTPAVYVVEPDLSLSGTWAGGLGTERLTVLP